MTLALSEEALLFHFGSVSPMRGGIPGDGLRALRGLRGENLPALRLGLRRAGLSVLSVIPFLSQSFIDLEMTDRLAQRELESLLLDEDFERLRRTAPRRPARRWIPPPRPDASRESWGATDCA